MSDSELFVKLRYCFTAGYTLPQYCIDNGIKRPLFVLEKNSEWFLREIYAQFRYDKRLRAQFSFIDASEDEPPFLPKGGFLEELLQVGNFRSMNLNAFDKIIFLTSERPKERDSKFIYIAAVNEFSIRRAFVEIPILHFLNRFPTVKLFLTNFPNHINRYKGGVEFSKQLPDAEKLYKILYSNKGEHIETLFDELGYNNSEVMALLQIDKSKEKLDGSTTLLNDAHPFKQIKNGKRTTAYQAESYTNRIYFFGPCHYFGRNAPYDKTIESYLQQMLNEAGLPYRVENEGQAFAWRCQDIFYNLNALNPAPGDIIFLHFCDIRSNNDVIPFCDVSDAFDPPQDFRKIFCTTAHVNELGYKLVAEKYFKFLKENNFFRDVCFNYPTPPPCYHRYGIPPQFEAGGVNVPVSEELTAYKQSLRAKRLPIGAIVMNCNPFTLGHQYLVEYAAAQVVRLYLFVVEEDRSEFPFNDRLELVKQGVAHLSNVEVLPSGKFIISQTTFSGYFSKASLQDVAVDSSEDVEIFGKEIAPTLGITIRFAGSEPKDNVTRQYNETMRALLPRYGVEFREIPRKEFGNEVISASSVRKALKRGDMDKVKSLVPATTFEYLRGNQAEFQRRYFTARVDVKLWAQGDFQILNLSDDKATVEKPDWFQKDGIGYMIQCYGDKLEFVAKADVDGRITAAFGGVSVISPADKSKRLPYWIDYTKLTINGETIFDTVTPTWLWQPYKHSMDVKAGEEVTVQVEWQPHDS